MRQSSSAISQTVPQRLINRDRAAGSIQVNGPGSFKRGFGRKIQAESYAEFTLLPVGVLLQFRSAQGKRRDRRTKA